MMDESDILKNGTRVRLHSLRRQTQYNDALGTIADCRLDNGDIAYSITLDRDGHAVTAPSRHVSAVASPAKQREPQRPPPSNIKPAIACRALASQNELEDLLGTQASTIVGIFSQRCPPCRQLQPVFLAEAKVHATQCFGFVVVDPDVVPKVAKKYAVTQIPTVLHFVNGQLDRKLTITGCDPGRLKENIQQIDSKLNRQMPADGGVCHLPGRAEKEKAARLREQEAMARRQADETAKAEQRLRDDKAAAAAAEAEAAAATEASYQTVSDGPAGLLHQRVHVHGILKRPELNGQCGNATSFSPSKGRYRVKLDDENEKELYLKPENLQPEGKADPGQLADMKLDDVDDGEEASMSSTVPDSPGPTVTPTLPPALPQPPREIEAMSIEESNEVQRSLQALMSQPWVTWFPRVCISYATGTRAGIDAKGAGPGIRQVATITRALANADIACASGLCVPAGHDWEEFLPKINSRWSKCEVLVVLLSAAFYRSIPCLKEVYQATKGKKLQIIPLRCEEVLTSKDEQWLDVEPEQALILNKVQDALSINALPPRGCFFDSDAYLEDLVSRCAPAP